ncbi:hypothetical protein [Bhargavaea beijingensis]|uniref:Uncharacterized protein n=1 Tax=Bhargavaea beijingensis TaxID=426756 RepID=A0ABX9ZC80_9BACL|nr:hypothetical protein [Bhargavaea beijingensis]RSK30968.1 hypothetical protein EJA12_09635 [Bhargavaea beijingensis]
MNLSQEKKKELGAVYRQLAAYQAKSKQRQLTAAELDEVKKLDAKANRITGGPTDNKLAAFFTNL